MELEQTRSRLLSTFIFIISVFTLGFDRFLDGRVAESKEFCKLPSYTTASEFISASPFNIGYLYLDLYITNYLFPSVLRTCLIGRKFLKVELSCMFWVSLLHFNLSIWEFGS